MLKQRLYSSQYSFFEKLMNMDYFLIFIIILIGVISIFAMYSTDGGEILYHTKSHLVRFSFFFGVFLVFSFIRIKFWY